MPSPSARETRFPSRPLLNGSGFSHQHGMNQSHPFIVVDFLSSLLRRKQRDFQPLAQLKNHDEWWALK